MLVSSDQVFENNWAVGKFTQPMDISIPFLPKHPYHYTFPIPDVRTDKTGVIQAIEQCQRLYDIYGKTLNVLLSGGVDSQAVAWAAYKSGVPFRVTITVFQNDLNLHDVQTGIDFCNALGIPYTVLNVDAVRFYVSGEYLNYIEPYLCNSPQIAMHLKMVEELRSQGDYCYIFGGCPITVTDGSISGVQEFTLLAWNRYSQMHGVPIIGNFHTWSQQLFYRYLESHTAIEDEARTKYLNKCALYRHEGFPIIPQTKKYTGFEKVAEYFQQLYPKTPDAFNVYFRHPHQASISVVTTAEILPRCDPQSPLILA